MDGKNVVDAPTRYSQNLVHVQGTLNTCKILERTSKKIKVILTSRQHMDYGAQEVFHCCFTDRAGKADTQYT